MSAKKTDGRLEFVRLLSEIGGNITVTVGDASWISALQQKQSRHEKPQQGKIDTLPPGVPVFPVADGRAGTFTVCLKADMHVVLFPHGYTPKSLVISPLAPNASELNWFGFRRPMQPLH